ncbi:TPA: hypothetical protein HA235_01240 [Candidatus Woesearchaeota archaeon]|nr:hypothetical protein [Candidatus Woesearchaeota archaeon]HIH31308.1 hypothetical protein [Candidatus Woesearchaeota archaeon]HIH55401.1 hypothetical protein [Candidatus Woesearchaeota archaeon]HIJ01593.1 hypothetical protein [Candidatus Woesearchaeota archaeon]HIJ14592.1 hypothetical protein [Candidatus Woesearchaeota archaeon]
MKVALIKDNSAPFDTRNWHDIYAEHFRDMGVSTVFLDPNKSSFIDDAVSTACGAYLWRVWHVPQDRIDATRKIRFLEKECGLLMFPTHRMLEDYDDKASELFFMRKQKYPIPETFFTRSSEEAKDYCQTCALPIVSKAYDGASGDNVRLLNNRDSLISHVNDAFSQTGIKTHFSGSVQQGYIFLQKYIPCKKDMKIIVIGEEVALSYWRKGLEWKHNISSGGSIDTTPIPEQAKQLAVQITKDLKYDWCGLDFIEHDNRIFLIEYGSMFAITPRFIPIFGSIDADMLRKQCELVVKRIKK